MKLKLRGKKNAKGEKVWAIYEKSGGIERLRKRLGPIPKSLAEQLLKKELVQSLCDREGIRQNRDIPLDVAIDEYLERKASPPHKSLKSYLGEKYVSRQVKRVMAKVFRRLQPYRSGPVLVPEITLTVLDSYKVTRGAETVQNAKKGTVGARVSNRTINVDLNLIRNVLRYCVEANYLIRFPFEEFKNLPEDEPKREWLSDVTEIEKLCAAGKNPEARIKIRLGLETGLRSGEILRLPLSAVDLQRQVFTVFGQKEGRFKEIPMSDDMARMLAPLMTHRYKKSGHRLYPRAEHQMRFLFCNESGEPYKSLRKSWGNAKAAAGISRKVTPHSMRHTFASHLLESGANPVDVSKMLGHKQVSTTLDIYAHSSKEGRRKSFDKLPYLRRPEADIIPLRKAVGDDFSQNLYAKSGSKSVEEVLLDLMQVIDFKSRGAGIRTPDLLLPKLGGQIYFDPKSREIKAEIGIFIGGLKTVSDPF